MAQAIAFIVSRLMSMLISRYLEKALLSSTCPLMLQMMHGSFTLLFRLPMNVRRAMCLLAISQILTVFSIPVIVSRAITFRVTLHRRKICFSALLYSCPVMNGNSLPFSSIPQYFFISSCASLSKGTVTNIGFVFLVFLAMYVSTVPLNPLCLIVLMMLIPYLY